MEQTSLMPQISRVIWEQTWQEEVCVQVPFDGRQCVKITAAVRIIEDNGYFIELQLFGARQRFAIAEICYPVLNVGIGSLTVCTSNLQINEGQLISVKISVDGCIGTKIGPINVQKCWKLFDQDIHFFHFDSVASKELGFTGINKETIHAGYNDIAYIDSPSNKMLAARLSSISLSGFTPDGGNDKDANSQIKITVFIDYGGGFIQVIGATDYQSYARFVDGQKWGPLDVPINGTFTIDNISKVKGKLDFQPNGDDTWKYTSSLNFTFDDGTVISKTGAGTVSDKSRSADL
jgi:hypothetical protein